MWCFLKKQGALFDIDRDDMTISAGYEDDAGINCWFLNYRAIEGEDVQAIELDREKLDMFVTQFEDAIKHKEHVFTFDEDKPKYRMRLSGRGDDHEPDPIQMDVGLE